MALLRVAGHLLRSRPHVRHLSLFGRSGAVNPDSHDLLVVRSEASMGGEGEPVEVVFEGTGLLASRDRIVRCSASSSGLRLDVDGIGSFFVARNGAEVSLVEATGDERVIEETLLGAPLILALAFRGTFCLHASAAMIDGTAVAFLGGSGVGKSTLARFIDDSTHGQARRIADDVLPVCVVDGRVEALPHFPQLKLSPEEQRRALGPERLPLRAVYALDSAEEGEAVGAIPLSRRDGALRLMSCTQASRLFDRELLEAHFRFCSAAAAVVPVRRLVYPRRFELLPLVREAIEADLASLAYPSCDARPPAREASGA